MAHVHDARGSTHNTRRAPTAHSDEVQEAKRLEKMQSHSSSHRAAGPADRNPEPTKGAVN
ncbi:hypothetical protein D3273_20850 [Lichenibacterium minor]|uniref:Uncharacterized protein n=1 Tax=Lichenibacterium minor TaxID=2316528 RepID=A0A4Q2U5J1_9HYPH|nr:hypothetical protein [Lichenibacterium minor]RYC30066.1 hypothetical protein D3273_20850 [Lichenibacterium minor]